MIGWAGKPEWNDYFCDRELHALCSFKAAVALPVPMNKPTYVAGQGKKKYYEAEMSCQDMGGHLASIDSLEEEVWAYDVLEAANFDRTWIGTNDIGKEKKWRNAFKAGRPEAPWKHFLPNQPDNWKNEDCVEVRRKSEMMSI